MLTWSEDLAETITQILQADKHHDTYCYMTGYQLASELCTRMPSILEATGLKFGGAGTGSYNSFVRTLSDLVAQKIKVGELPGIERSYLSKAYLTAMQFKDPEGSAVASSLIGSNPHVLFRYVG